MMYGIRKAKGGFWIVKQTESSSLFISWERDYNTAVDIARSLNWNSRKVIS